MAGIGEASAILGVAQIGLQLVQTLVTVIGDYRDAAININRLRDEIHLTSICLQQLGDLAKDNKLIPGRGVLEATNLRERCRAVIWEIRTTIQKSDTPLHPDEISKDDIDVSYFTSWKWALWTKKHLDGPRQELDRLKDSMTLTFVTHMAILASSEAERRRYEAQIPGYRRSCWWSEEKYRTDSEPEVPLVPDDVLNADPETWDAFIAWKNDPVTSTLQKLRTQVDAGNISQAQLAMAFQISADSDRKPRPVAPKAEYQAWSMDPFVGRVQMPVTEDWLRQAVARPQSSEEMWKTHSKLQSWYKKQLDELIADLASAGGKWTLFSLQTIHRSIFRRTENPPSLQVVVKGEVDPLLPTSRIIMPDVALETRIADATTYNMTEDTIDPETSKTDEELIAEQLDRYKSGSVQIRTPAA